MVGWSTSLQQEAQFFFFFFFFRSLQDLLELLRDVRLGSTSLV